MVQVKNLPAKAGNTKHKSLIPVLGRPHRVGNSNSLHYSCLENPMDRGAFGLQSKGSQRVGHDWATKDTHTHTHTHIEKKSAQWNQKVRRISWMEYTIHSWGYLTKFLQQTFDNLYVPYALQGNIIVSLFIENTFYYISASSLIAR